MPNLNKKIDDFFDRKEKLITAKQKEIANDAMTTLFEFSPHFTQEFMTSDGEYDANHKISINGNPRSSHVAPTKSIGASKAINTAEKLKINNIEIGDVVEISNDTPHRFNVETGAGWSSNGYYTFGKTIMKIMGEHRNVIR